MATVIAFGRHIGDIGARDHPKMHEWVPRLNEALATLASGSRIVNWFDDSGNFVVVSRGEDLQSVASDLEATSRKEFVAVDRDSLKRWLDALKSSVIPPAENGFRWTPCLSIRVDVPTDLTSAERWSTPNGFYFPIAAQCTAVWKRDRLMPGGDKLDTQNRTPLGALSRDCEARLGGRWTSRTSRTVDGILRRACETPPNRPQVNGRPQQMMLDSRTDAKNIELLKLLAQLRDHIDMHRVIGLNLGALRKSQISGALLGYLQKSAHESLAIYICKIFEASTRNDLNSIPGIIESIPAVPASDRQRQELAAFGSKYGQDTEPTDARSYLADTFVRFRDAHSASLGRLKEFRDTIGAHSDYCAHVSSLPSHPEFETLFSFAKDFYEVVSRSIIGSGPAMIPRTVGRGFLTLIGTLGVQDPRYGFEEDK